jgi:hypothetical protein
VDQSDWKWAAIELETYPSCMTKVEKMLQKEVRKTIHQYISRLLLLLKGKTFLQERKRHSPISYSLFALLFLLAMHLRFLPRPSSAEKRMIRPQPSIALSLHFVLPYLDESRHRLHRGEDRIRGGCRSHTKGVDKAESKGEGEEARESGGDLGLGCSSRGGGGGSDGWGEGGWDDGGGEEKKEKGDAGDLRREFE